MAPAAAIACGFRSDAALPRQFAQPCCALPQEVQQHVRLPYTAPPCVRARARRPLLPSLLATALWAALPVHAADLTGPLQVSDGNTCNSARTMSSPMPPAALR